MSDETIEIRPASIDDCKGLARLQIETFSPKRNSNEVQAHMRWKYFEQPQSRAHLLLAEHENEVVGSYGGISFPLLVFGEAKESIMMTTTAVAQAFRGQGLYRKLQAAFSRHLEELDSSIIFGFPNPLAQKIGSKHLPYTTGAEFRDYHIPLHFGAHMAMYPALRSRGFYQRAHSWVFSRLHRRIPRVNFFASNGNNGLDLRRERIEPEDCDALLQKLREHYPVQTGRSTDFIRWRFFQEPYKTTHFCTIRDKGTLLAYFALQPGELATVLEFYSLPEKEVRRQAFQMMLAYACEQAGAMVLRYPINNRPIENLIAQAGGVLRNCVNLTVNVDFLQSSLALSVAQRRTVSTSWYLGGSEWLLG